MDSIEDMKKIGGLIGRSPEETLINVRKSPDLISAFQGVRENPAYVTYDNSIVFGEGANRRKHVKRGGALAILSGNDLFMDFNSDKPPSDDVYAFRKPPKWLDKSTIKNTPTF